MTCMTYLAENINQNFVFLAKENFWLYATENVRSNQIKTIPLDKEGILFLDKEAPKLSTPLRLTPILHPLK